MGGVAQFFERVDTRHEQEVADGKHDADCEFVPGRLYMCHCPKRRRIAAGHTTPPGPLEWQSPLCPGCWREAEHDGDGFVCRTCSVSWSPTDDSDVGTFTDDYGDDLADVAARYRAESTPPTTGDPTP